MQLMKGAFIVGAAVIVAQPVRDDSPDFLRASVASETVYPTDAALLEGELQRLRRGLDPSTGSSLYASFSLGYPLVTTIFAQEDPAPKRAVIGMMADLVRSLPRYGELLDRYGDGPALRALDALSPRARSAGRRLGVDAAAFDGLPLPSDPSLRNVRMFPLRNGEKLEINTGNLQQFGYLLSTLVRLAASDPAIWEDRAARADLQLLATYLSRDFLAFYWAQAPAWHWVAPFPGGIRARTIARLEGGGEMERRQFFKAFLDYDLHVMAAGADLRAAARSHPQLFSAADLALFDDVHAIALRVLAARMQSGAPNDGFAFDRGYWDDNPVAEYGGCRDRTLPTRKCPIFGYTTDISHAQRWPAWLESFAASTDNPVQRQQVDRWRRALAERLASNVRYVDGRLLLPNFLDGRDGWMLVTGSEGGRGAHPPSSMTGWAMRYGFYARLAPLDRRIAEAQRRFCVTISSAEPRDIAFRKANYGEPETNPANPLRPQLDEYGPAGSYAHICRMMELQGFIATAGPVT